MLEKSGAKSFAARHADAQASDWTLRNMARLLAVGNVYFHVAARCGRVHSGDDSFKMQTDVGPLLVAEHHDGDFAAYEIFADTACSCRY